MNRATGLIGATFVASQLVCGGPLAAAAHDPVRWRAAHQRVVKPSGPVLISSETGAPRSSAAPVPAVPIGPSMKSAGAAKQAARDQPRTDRLPGDLPALSAGLLSRQQLAVRNIALGNGDRTFLMVDKGTGKILLFDDGIPVFRGNALTGESHADRLAPKDLLEKMESLNALDTKITPAGRFTVTRGYNKDYGPLLDINQIKGADWGLAIHQVYLGTPSENRASRLRSARDDDKAITFGCINVTPDTLQLLLRALPEHGPSALYVLPRDTARTTAYFAPHGS